MANDTVMGHMGAGHKQIIVTDLGFAAALDGAGIDSHIFTKNIIGTDSQEDLVFLLVLSILRRAADAAPRCAGGTRPQGWYAPRRHNVMRQW